MQPQIDKDLALLHPAYRMPEGLVIDLYGMEPQDDGEGYLVVDVAIAGTTVSLVELMPDPTLREMNSVMRHLSQWCDDNLPSGAQARNASRLEAEIDSAEERKREFA